MHWSCSHHGRKLFAFFPWMSRCGEMSHTPNMRLEQEQAGPLRAHGKMVQPHRIPYPLVGLRVGHALSMSPSRPRRYTTGTILQSQPHRLSASAFSRYIDSCPITAKHGGRSRTQKHKQENKPSTTHETKTPNYHRRHSPCLQSGRICSRASKQSGITLSRWCMPSHRRPDGIAKHDESFPNLCPLRRFIRLGLIQMV